MGRLAKKEEKSVVPQIEQIEVALAQYFNYLHNIVVFNVKGWSALLPFYHECDVLVCTKAGYLTEVEIKRSWGDFLADFKKKHKHETEKLAYLYYCVPQSFDTDKMVHLLEANGVRFSGILAYDNDCNIKVAYINSTTFKKTKVKGKLTQKQMLELARLGSIRCVSLKKKINYLKGLKHGNSEHIEDN